VIIYVDFWRAGVKKVIFIFSTKTNELISFCPKIAVLQKKTIGQCGQSLIFASHSQFNDGLKIESYFFATKRE
jgi:hypothetical protein